MTETNDSHTTVLNAMTKLEEELAEQQRIGAELTNEFITGKGDLTTMDMIKRCTTIEAALVEQKSTNSYLRAALRKGS